MICAYRDRQPADAGQGRVMRHWLVERTLPGELLSTRTGGGTDGGEVALVESRDRFRMPLAAVGPGRHPSCRQSSSGKAPRTRCHDRGARTPCFQAAPAR